MIQLDQETLRVGDTVQLNSGSPNWKVLAVKDGNVAVDAPDTDGKERLTLPSACFTRTPAS